MNLKLFTLFAVIFSNYQYGLGQFVDLSMFDIPTAPKNDFAENKPLPDYLKILGKIYFTREFDKDLSNVEKIAVSYGKLYYKTSTGTLKERYGGIEDTVTPSNDILDEIDGSHGFEVSSKLPRDGCFYLKDNICIATARNHAMYKFTHLRRAVGFLIGFDDFVTQRGRVYVFNMDAALKSTAQSDVQVFCREITALGSNVQDLAVDQTTGSVYVIRFNSGSGQIVTLSKVDAKRSDFDVATNESECLQCVEAVSENCAEEEKQIREKTLILENCNSNLTSPDEDLSPAIYSVRYQGTVSSSRTPDEIIKLTRIS